MSKVLVTPRSLSRELHPSLSPLLNAGLEIVTPAPGQTPSEAELIKNLPGCVGWLAGVEPVSESVIDHAVDLKIISRNGSGIDNLPVDYLKRKGVRLKTSVGTNARGVAELSIALMLSVIRNIPQCDKGVKLGHWPRVKGRELASLTVGVVGLGAIGQTTSELCLAMGTNVVGHDPFVKKLPDKLARVEIVSLDRLFRESDIITFHCPATQDGKPLLGSTELATARDDIIVINTARANLIDETAMLDALNDGKVFGLATDVFDLEPPALTSLLLHDRVITTSHIGAFTAESVQRATQAAVANLLEALELA